MTGGKKSPLKVYCAEETNSFVEVINEQQTMKDLQKPWELHNPVLLHAFPSSLRYNYLLITHLRAANFCRTLDLIRIIYDAHEGTL